MTVCKLTSVFNLNICARGDFLAIACSKRLDIELILGCLKLRGATIAATLANIDDFDLESQRRSRRNNRAIARISVSKLRWARQDSLLLVLKLCHGLVPALDDLALADDESHRLSALLVRSVED